GRHFIYFLSGPSDVRGIYLAGLDSSESRRLTPADAGAVYLVSGYLLFVRQATLYAERFDQASLTLNGTPLPVAEHVAVDLAFGAPGVSAATNGLVLYREGGGALIKNYAWFNRAGQALGQLPEPGDIDLGLSSMAPDGRHMALSLAA